MKYSFWKYLALFHLLIKKSKGVNAITPFYLDKSTIKKLRQSSPVAHFQN